MSILKDIPKTQAQALRGDINLLAGYVKELEEKINSSEKKVNFSLFEIADLFMANNNYKRAYILYENVLNEDIESFNKNGDVTEKDFTAFIITSVKLYLCALQLTANELKEAEIFIKDNLLAFKNICVVEEYEKVLNENLKAYEELQDIKKLEIFKILFLSQDEDKNFVDHTEQNFTKNKQGDE